MVVTIVVLIILATISINAVLGENGLIRKAQEAKELHESAASQEQEALNTLLGEYDRLTATAGTVLATKPSTWTSTEVTPISDGNGGIIPLPNGFHYVGGNIGSGIVISDKEGDTMNATGTSMGNQFVWIPVSSEADLTRTMFKNGQPSETDEYNTTLDDFTEPYASGYSTEGDEYTAMHDQVLKYNGFYIGRFEAGVNSTDKRTGTTEAQTVVCKRGVAPYNFVPWGTAMDDASEISGQSGAVYLAKNFSSQERYTSVTSTLCYGCQWDAMCRYIGDSGRTTQTKDAVELTGNVSTDVSKNIYDLAGNCYEWTMEADYTYGRVGRGGGYSGASLVSDRHGGVPDDNGDGGISFRPTLYIK